MQPKGILIESKLNGFWGVFLNFHRGEGRLSKVSIYSITFCRNFLNSILMPVSVCTQKEFLIESKLNGFWGVLLVLLDLAVPLLLWFTHRGLYLL